MNSHKVCHYLRNNFKQLFSREDSRSRLIFENRYIEFQNNTCISFRHPHVKLFMFPQIKFYFDQAIWTSMVSVCN